MNYNAYFGFKKQPFAKDIKPQNLLKLPGMLAVKQRLDYVASVNGMMVVTGEVGSGKSTSLRWSTSHYHSSEYLVLNVIGTSASIIDFYRSLCWSMDLNVFSVSRTKLIKTFKEAIRDLVVAKKKKILLTIDEASLLRPEIFTEIHVLTQFENDSQGIITVVFAGQANLIDKFLYRNATPLASRIIARTHLIGISRDQMEEYIVHHQKIAGVKKNLFSDEAITAIHQGSGGLLRKANSLASGGLIAAATENDNIVTAEHIRIASTELI